MTRGIEQAWICVGEKIRDILVLLQAEMDLTPEQKTALALWAIEGLCKAADTYELLKRLFE